MSLAHVSALKCMHLCVRVHIPVKVEQAVNAICQVGMWVSFSLPLVASKCYKCKYECEGMLPYNMNRQSAS